MTDSSFTTSGTPARPFDEWDVKDKIEANTTWIRSMRADGWAFVLEGEAWDMESYHIRKGEERDDSELMIAAMTLSLLAKERLQQLH